MLEWRKYWMTTVCKHDCSCKYYFLRLILNISKLKLIKYRKQGRICWIQREESRPESVWHLTKSKPDHWFIQFLCARANLRHASSPIVDNSHNHETNCNARRTHGDKADLPEHIFEFSQSRFCAKICAKIRGSIFTRTASYRIKIAQLTRNPSHFPAWEKAR